MKYIEERVKRDGLPLILFNGDTRKRSYENGVFISFSIKDNQEIHINVIESEIKGKGHGTEIMKEILQEFPDYDITLDAVEYAIEWYKSFGFKQMKPVDFSGCASMILKRGV